VIAGKVVVIVLSLSLIQGLGASAQMRPITVEDCVRTRRVVEAEVQVSPDGSRIAYVVKAPDVVADRNDFELYIRSLGGNTERENGHLILQADGISGIRWLGPTRLLARVQGMRGNRGNGEDGLYLVNLETGASERLMIPNGFEQFSANSDGRIIVFSKRAQGSAEPDRDRETMREKRGFAVLFGEGDAATFDHLPEDEIFLATRSSGRRFVVKKLDFSESADSAKQWALRNVVRLDLSPDGKRVLLVYSARRFPAGWADEPYIRYVGGFGTLSNTYVLGLYDMKSGRLRLGFNFPGGLLHTRWADDSRAYSVVGPSPFGTQDAKAESQAGSASGNIFYFMLRFQHVFVVDPQTGNAVRALSRQGGQPGNLKFMQDLPLSWRRFDGPMLVRAGENTFVWLAIKDGKWKETEQFDLWKHQAYLSSMASNGQCLVGVSQTTMVPPDIFALDLKSKRTTRLTDLNPEFKHIELGNVERLEWTNRFGSDCSGLLIKPVGYRGGQRYPMIFLSAPPSDVFISDAVYTTAYAPQSLANAGFIVVMAEYPADNKIPKGTYPGEMSDAYNWMAMVESAVDLLVGRGIVDKNRTGIAGFSRTSWLTDFTLTHSAYNFVAASSADSGIYTYGEYFRFNSREWMRGAEAQIGGPPYGDTFEEWIDSAAPFRAANVHAAVLMEYIRSAESGLEFFTALSRLGKAVELFRYPNGRHPLDTPYERVASLQRNLDWFRFWLQDYEGQSPAYDPGQYSRWHKLRDQQRWNNRIRASGKDPSLEFLRQTKNGVSGVIDPAPAAVKYAN